VNIGWVSCGTKLQVLFGPVNKLESCGLCPPSAPLKLNRGKYSAFATPI
jgi:hypothetical protein